MKTLKKLKNSTAKYTGKGAHFNFNLAHVIVLPPFVCFTKEKNHSYGKN